MIAVMLVAEDGGDINTGRSESSRHNAAYYSKGHIQQHTNASDTVARVALQLLVIMLARRCIVQKNVSRIGSPFWLMMFLSVRVETGMLIGTWGRWGKNMSSPC